MSTRWSLKVAPGGNSFGVVGSQLGDYSVRLVIVPKLWTSVASPQEIRWRRDEKHLAIEAPETQSVEIVTETPEQGSVIYRLLEESGQNPAVAGLIGAAAPSSHVVLASQLEVHFEKSLLALGLEHGAVSLDGSRNAAIGSGGGDLLDRLILIRTFLTAAQVALQNIKPGYVERISKSATIKGRPDTGDLLQWIRHDAGYIRSRHSELTMDTPTLKFIASALQAAVLRVAPRRTNVVAAQLYQELMALRAAWPAASYDPRAAVGHAVTAERGARGPSLKSAVRLARLVLGLSGRLIEAAPAKSSWYCMAIDAATLWERIAVKRLKEIGFSETVDVNRNSTSLSLESPRPWRIPGTRQSRPDILYLHEKSWVVADAKYKLLDGPAPSAADLNQVFAYSRLCQLAGTPPARVDLIYPTTVTELESGPFPSELPAGQPIYVRKLRFPAPDEIEIPA